MRKIITISIGLLLIFLLTLPPAAEASRRGRGGGVILGFGAGLLTGFLFTPRAVVVPPPVYYAPVPAPTPPPVYGYSERAPQPGAQAKCREWSLLERRYQDSWDPYYGRWRSVPVEKWGWADVPCRN